MPKHHKSLPQKKLRNEQNKIIKSESLPQHEEDVEESMDGIY